MDEIYEIYKKTMDSIEEMKQFKEQQLRNLKAILYGPETDENKENNENASLVESGNGTPATKRAKRLSALEENEDEPTTTSTRASGSRNKLSADNGEKVVTSTRRSPRNKARISATIVEATSTTSHEEDIAKELEAMAAPVNVTAAKSAVDLMPPPAVPTVSATTSEQSFSRPQRAAKLNCEKHLKEPKLNNKLRRPTEHEVQIKLEHEQRASQMHETGIKQKKHGKNSKSNASIASTASQDSVIVLPNKTPSIVTIADQSDQSTVADEPEKSASKENASTTVHVTREVSVRVKREKISTNGLPNRDENFTKTVTQKEATTLTESTIFSTTTAGNTTHETTAQGKKGQRKKKIVPRPIKVERLSNDAAEKEPSPPIAARTRGANGSFEHNKNQTNQQMAEATSASDAQNTTTYEEANDNPQQPVLEKHFVAPKHMNTPPLNNETITITAQNSGSIGAGIAATSSATPTNATMVLGAAPNDATYCTAAAATFVVDQPVGACSDLTFDVASGSKDGTESQRSSDQSMATARDTLQPRAESLMTEDESDAETPVSKPVPASKKPMPKMNTLPFAASKKAPMPPAKSYKLPVREIFNPLIQSPVKKKVEAFESVAAANKNARSARSKLAKENSKPQMSTSSSATTPLIGKTSTSAAASSRFCTPTQSINLVTPNAMVAAKKFPASASKAMSLTKSSSADKIWVTGSAKAPSREHSAEDFRRGTQQLAEERKKQRDQRHLQAAQQREAKERERAERLAKAAKEREEKRLKKQQLAEQKHRELQEIQRKLKQQEEAAAAAAAAEVAAQREKLAKLASQQNVASGSSSARARMPPPQPKSKYTFEMLHEDDSTDDEGKVTYKRPPPPTWSLSHVRGPAILTQQHMPNEPVDFLFSVQPRTLDLKIIFPKIDPRYLKRNSSAIWQTPPRYSELPKY